MTTPRPPVHRPCIAFDAGLISPDQLITDRKTQAQLARTNVGYIRLWAIWSRASQMAGWPLDPLADVPRDSYIGTLDRNIAVARGLGYRIALTPTYKPADVEGLAGKNPEDPYACGRRRGSGDPPAEEPNQGFRFPADASLRGPYGRWIDFLVRRYARTTENQERCVDFLEVLNEPNWEMWPQLDANCRLVSAPHAADMMMTAKRIRDALGRHTDLIMLGPGALDYARSVNDGIGTTSFDVWVEAFLRELRARRFLPGTRWAWSQHSYGDSEGQRFVMPRSWRDRRRTVNRGQLARLMLERHGWGGWPGGDPRNPHVLFTEGGIRLSQAGRNRRVQGRLMEQWLDALSGSHLGDGVAMVTNFKLFDAVDWISGLCPTYDVARVGQFHPSGDAFRRWAARHP